MVTSHMAHYNQAMSTGDKILYLNLIKNVFISIFSLSLIYHDIAVTVHKYVPTSTGEHLLLSIYLPVINYEN